jgi:RND family efflux transporter MFP subunit
MGTKPITFPAAASRGRLVRFLGAAAWLAAALATVAPVCAASQAVVPTALVQAAGSAAGFHIDGRLEPLRQSTLGAQVGGNILVRAVKAGDRVKAGQLIARIDERSAQAGLAQSEAGVAQADATLRNARLHAERTRELRGQGFVSQAAVDVAESQLAAAQAGLQQAQAGRSQAALSRGYASVTAPFDAVVLATHVEAGDLATPGLPLVTLYAPGEMRAVVQLPASRSAAARAAPSIEVELPDGRRVVPARRTDLPTADPVSQTVEWRLELAPEDVAGLMPGQNVRVFFTGAATSATAPARLTVPAGAVLRRGELTAVYAAQEGRFVLKAVRLGAAQGGAVEVLAGLKAGERVALDPVRAGLAGATPAP